MKPEIFNMCVFGNDTAYECDKNLVKVMLHTAKKCITRK